MNNRDPRYPPHVRLPRRVYVPVRRPQQIPAQPQKPEPAPDSRLEPGQEAKPEPQVQASIAPDTHPTSDARPQAMKEAELEAEISRWKERYARLQAELDNSKKRIEKRYSTENEQARRAFLADMLVVADNLDAALRHSDDRDEAHLREGVELTLRGFLDMLARHGVTPIEAEGKPFDPAWHDAVGHVETDSTPSGHVAQVLQKGYTVDGVLLRPARVLVAN